MASVIENGKSQTFELYRDGSGSTSPRSEAAMDLRDSEKDDALNRPGTSFIPDWLSVEQLPAVDFSSSTIETYVYHGLAVLMPSFLRRSPREGTPRDKLHPTAYLDGLRGVAAFGVLLHHFVLDWFPSLYNGYASTPQDYYIFQLPFIRLLLTGQPMVMIFFVISGYALSYKAIRLMHEGKFESVLDVLASSLFRRGFRLYLPLFVSTFISMLFTHLDWYSHIELRNVIPERLGSLYAQNAQWMETFFQMMNPFIYLGGNRPYIPLYDGHLWTIPIEFHGSLIVFLTLLWISRLRPTFRFLHLALVVSFLLHIGQWDLFLFLGGTLLAELHFIRKSWTKQQQPLPHSTSPGFGLSHAQSRFRSIVLSRSSGCGHAPSAAARLHTAQAAGSALCLVLALYLLSLPADNAHLTPGYRSIVAGVPAAYAGWAERYVLCLGALLLLLVLDHSPLLRAPLTSPVAQYLGRISYSLYVVHGPLLYTLGMWIFVKAGGGHEPGSNAAIAVQMAGGAPPRLGKGQVDASYVFGFMWACLIMLPVVVWAADLFCRVVDEKCVLLAKWLSRKVWIRD